MKNNQFFLSLLCGALAAASNIHGKSGEFYNLTAHYLANMASVNVEKTMTVGGNTLLSGALNVLTTQNSANVINLTTNGGPNERIVIENKQGTSYNAITLFANKGQIFIASNANKGNGDVCLYTYGGSNDQIFIENTQGTNPSAIKLSAWYGGIELNATNGGITFNGIVHSAPFYIDFTNAIQLSTISNVNIINTNSGSHDLTSTAITMPADPRFGQICIVINILRDISGVTWSNGVVAGPTTLKTEVAYMFICTQTNKWSYIPAAVAAA